MKKFTFLLFFCLSVLAFAEDSFQKGYMLQQDGSVWTEDARGIMRWKESVKSGTAFDVYVTDLRDSNGNLIEEVKVANRLDGANNPIKNEFVRIRYKGEDAYVIKNRIAKDCELGIIQRTCAVYLSLNLSDVRLSPIEAGKIVATGNTYPVEGGFNFTEITFFDEVNFIMISGYVKEQNIGQP